MTMRERVAKAIRSEMMPPIVADTEVPEHLSDYYLEIADAAVIAVIEALAAEAEASQLQVIRGLPDMVFLSEWIRTYLPTGRDGEAGDE